MNAFPFQAEKEAVRQLPVKKTGTMPHSLGDRPRPLTGSGSGSKEIWRETPPPSWEHFHDLSLHYARQSQSRMSRRHIDILKQVHTRNGEVMRMKSIPTEPSEN